MARIRDLTGQRFGRWVVLKEAGRDVDGSVLWLCRCDCGTERVVPGCRLVRGRSRSCGCLRRDNTIEFNKTKIQEDPIYKQKLYQKWRDVRQKHKGKVCKEWIKSYYDFKTWALENGYVEGMRFKRIDDAYLCEPINCIWVKKGEHNVWSKQ